MLKLLVAHFTAILVCCTTTLVIRINTTLPTQSLLLSQKHLDQGSNKFWVLWANLTVLTGTTFVEQWKQNPDKHNWSLLNYL